MATGGLTPLRGNNTYIGWAKESVWGTPVAPTSYWRWLDGSSSSIKAQVATELEGDASPHKSLAFKESQYGEIKVVEYVRPRTVGCALQALLGTGSDNYTGPTTNTTLGANASAGATTIQTVADLGNTGTKILNLTPGTASATYEVVTIDCTTRTTPNFTYTLAASATLRNAHTSGDAVTSASSHVFTRQTTTFDPYTLETGRGDGSNAPFQVTRLTDAVCYDYVLTSARGKPLKAEHSWYGGVTKLQNSNATVTLEGSNQVGAAGGPLSHFMASGTWSLNSLTTGNALTVEQMALRMRNTTQATEFVTEAVNPSYFTLDNFEITLEATIIFQTFKDYYECYFGNTTAPAATATDSYLVGYGQFSATWSSDVINALALSIPYCAYTAAEPPAIKLDGKPVRQQIMLTPLKSPSNANPVTLTLTNSQASAY